MTFPFKIEENPDMIIDASIDGTDLALSNSRSGTTTVHSSGGVVPSGPKKRYMIIDETKLSKDDAERLLIKRAYNRECAERARKRCKETIQDLQQQVHELHADKVELRRTLGTKEAEIKQLQHDYKTLLLTTTLTQRIDIYPHRHSIGVSTKNALQFEVQPPEEQPVSSLSLLQLQRRGSGVGNYPHNISASLLSSWDHNRLS